MFISSDHSDLICDILLIKKNIKITISKRNNIFKNTLSEVSEKIIQTPQTAIIGINKDVIMPIILFCLITFFLLLFTSLFS